jgi:hypothetical protein
VGVASLDQLKSNIGIVKQMTAMTVAERKGLEQMMA